MEEIYGRVEDLPSPYWSCSSNTDFLPGKYWNKASSRISLFFTHASLFLLEQNAVQRFKMKIKKLKLTLVFEAYNNHPPADNACLKLLAHFPAHFPAIFQTFHSVLMDQLHIYRT